MDYNFDKFINEIEKKILCLSNIMKYNIKDKKEINIIINSLKISKINNVNKLLDLTRNIERIDLFIIILELYKDKSYDKKIIIKEIDHILIIFYKMIYNYVTKNDKFLQI